jgi:hypothetical protein
VARHLQPTFGDPPANRARLQPALASHPCKIAHIAITNIGRVIQKRGSSLSLDHTQSLPRGLTLCRRQHPGALNRTDTVTPCCRNKSLDRHRPRKNPKQKDYLFFADYPLGDDVLLENLRVRNLKCTCADASP